MLSGARALVCLALAVATASPLASAETASIAASKDNTLYESVSGSVSNGSGQYFFAGESDDGDLKRGAIAFAISDSIPAGATIESATLTLRMSKTRVSSRVVSLYALTADWGEGASNAFGGEGSGAAAQPGDATWVHTFYNTQFWSTPGGDYSPVASATAIENTRNLKTSRILLMITSR